MDGEKSIGEHIYKLGVGLSLAFVIIAIIGFLILMLPLFTENYNLNTLGALGDTFNIRLIYKYKINL